MSVFGGDSWVPESLHRKRRIDELLSEDVKDEEVRRMANGRLACLVCPHAPVLDTFSMLVMHRKGARHRAAAQRLREKELSKQEEIQKRTALAWSNPKSNNDRYGCSRNSPQLRSATHAPLLHATRKRAAEVLSQPAGKSFEIIRHDTLSGTGKPFVDHAESAIESRNPAQAISISEPRLNCNVKTGLPRDCNGASLNIQVPESFKQHLELCKYRVPESSQQQWEPWKQRERDLRLREAGWRRNGLGGWFKEENVEFDSDEEIPCDGF